MSGEQNAEMEQMREMMAQLMEQNAALVAQVQQMQGPSTQQEQIPAESAHAALVSATPDQKAGIGLVWGNVTGAIGASAGAVENASMALGVLARSGLYHTVTGQMDAAKELCNTLNIKSEGVDALMTADAIVNYVTANRSRK